MDHSGSIYILGIKFHPGAIYSLFPHLDGVKADSIIPCSNEQYSFLVSLPLPSEHDEMLSIINELDMRLLPLILNAREDRYSAISREVIQQFTSASLSQD